MLTLLATVFKQAKNAISPLLIKPIKTESSFNQLFSIKRLLLG